MGHLASSFIFFYSSEKFSSLLPECPKNVMLRRIEGVLQKKRVVTTYSAEFIKKGMSYIWNTYWVPLLKRQMPNKLSQLFLLFVATGSIQSDLPQHQALYNHRDT